VVSRGAKSGSERDHSLVHRTLLQTLVIILAIFFLGRFMSSGSGDFSDSGILGSGIMGSSLDSPRRNGWTQFARDWNSN
jgi:hypothetical protein